MFCGVDAVFSDKFINRAFIDIEIGLYLWAEIQKVRKC